MSIPWEIIIPPAGPEPLSLEEARTLCRLDEDIDAEDLYLQSLIIAARQKIERDTRRKLLRQTAATTRFYWPRERYITIPTLPVHSITGITYQTSSGPVTLPAERYALLTHENQYAAVHLVDGDPWPTTALVYPGVTTVFACGYDSVPELLMQALRSLVAYWYDNREAAIASTEYKADSALLPLQYTDLIRDYSLPAI